MSLTEETDAVLGSTLEVRPQGLPSRRDSSRKAARKGLTGVPRFWHSGQVPLTTGWLFENWVDEVDSGEIQTRKDQDVSSVRRGVRKGASSLTGEFDPGSESTLAACLTHASRARKGGNPRVERRTGE